MAANAPANMVGAGTGGTASVYPEPVMPGQPIGPNRARLAIQQSSGFNGGMTGSGLGTGMGAGLGAAQMGNVNLNQPILTAQPGLTAPMHYSPLLQGGGLDGGAMGTGMGMGAGASLRNAMGNGMGPGIGAAGMGNGGPRTLLGAEAVQDAAAGNDPLFPCCCGSAVVAEEAAEKTAGVGGLGAQPGALANGCVYHFSDLIKSGVFPEKKSDYYSV
ncbi:hypothetical protein EW145_g3400 [Phellinidium pouzarii]|uniref:Uncharacterized protein n=1 Tax=Phellinidium pouzarii TaxID=167371 RepID=A0A4S4L7I8_9AGAM|nr:hypothetical protein EW145_g3400 [Phellinidium pouzarii]